jgi:hypothetical protein
MFTPSPLALLTRNDASLARGVGAKRRVGLSCPALIGTDIVYLSVTVVVNAVTHLISAGIYGITVIVTVYGTKAG